MHAAGWLDLAQTWLGPTVADGPVKKLYRIQPICFSSMVAPQVWHMPGNCSFSLRTSNLAFNPREMNSIGRRGVRSELPA